MGDPIKQSKTEILFQRLQFLQESINRVAVLAFMARDKLLGPPTKDAPTEQKDTTDPQGILATIRRRVELDIDAVLDIAEKLKELNDQLSTKGDGGPAVLPHVTINK